MQSSMFATRTGTPSTSARALLRNQRSSTGVTPFPELKIRSMKSSPWWIFASQCGYAISATQPSARASSATRS